VFLPWLAKHLGPELGSNLIRSIRDIIIHHHDLLSRPAPHTFQSPPDAPDIRPGNHADGDGER